MLPSRKGGGLGDAPGRGWQARRRIPASYVLSSKALPNATVEVLPGQKHQATDTAPALFVKSVHDSLAG